MLKTIELGNVTRSAEFFGYTQSAVSQILSSIERDLGLKLLKRHRAGIELTAEGMSLLPFMTTICSDITALKEAASNLKLGISGLIKIGSFQSVACYMLPPLIRGFQSIYPKVHFDIKEGILSDIEKLLGNGEIDIGFVSIQNLSKFDAIKLKDDRLNVVLPKSHSYAEAEIFPLKQLADEPFIYLDSGGSSDCQVLFKGAGLKPNICYRTMSEQTAMSMVENGFGVTVLPEMVTDRTVFDVVVKRTEPEYCRTIGAILKDRKYTIGAVIRFLDYVISSVKTA